jgi:hypothetical protein
VDTDAADASALHLAVTNAIARDGVNGSQTADHNSRSQQRSTLQEGAVGNAAPTTGTPVVRRLLRVFFRR